MLLLPRTSSVHSVLWFALLLRLPSAVSGQQNFFKLLNNVLKLVAGDCTEPCGSGGAGYVMHTGTPGTSGCVERCVLAPLFNSASKCGKCGPVVVSGYDITLDFAGIPAGDESLFKTAAIRWQRIITSDLVNVSATELGDSPAQGCSYPAVVDDLYICATYAPNDGAGKTLGFASPQRWRTGGLPVTGFMSFDTADVNTLKASGNFDAIVRHEMGHLLGE